MKNAKTVKIGRETFTITGEYRATVDLLNSLLIRQKVGYMLLESAGKVYLLVEHWRYLNPAKEAKRVPLFKGSLSRNPLYVYSLLV